MSETIGQYGPLDNIRKICKSAAVIDEEIMRSKRATHPQSGNESFAELEKRLPILGQVVDIHGEVLERGMVNLKTGDMGLIVVPNSQSVAQGIYRGLMVRRVYDQTTGKFPHRLVHILEAGLEEGDNPFGDKITTQKRTFVCARKSSIFPVEPVNAHSTFDLKDDLETQEIDKIVVGSDTPYEMMWELGNFVNGLLRFGNGETSLNHQRVSYLNSLGHIQECNVSAMDYVIGDPQTGSNL